MVYKIRSVPAELCIWNSLLKRMKLHPNDKQYYSNLTRGYEGEVQFDALTEKLNCDCYLLQDLLLQTNNTTFQIDSLLITGNQLYIFEVKNYEGDYHYEQDKFFKKPQYEINNPLHQIGGVNRYSDSYSSNMESTFKLKPSLFLLTPSSPCIKYLKITELFFPLNLTVSLNN
ncbi:nuclease-related domain-containing protein [Virgibacillus halodenitrificans]|uniref:nuclease-related domain-containing protein n=1 Tax=Virgibacillus halodenitrificans TaxID=1482 RepID=UPI000ABA5F8B